MNRVCKYITNNRNVSCRWYTVKHQKVVKDKLLLSMDTKSIIWHEKSKFRNPGHLIPFISSIGML